MTTNKPSQNNLNLIGIVAHDLKTPIAAVRGFIELVEQAGPFTPLQKQYYDRALAGLQRMELLIANLLDMARLDGELVLNIKRCDLQQTVKNSVDLLQDLAKTRGITIVAEIQADARYVMGDVRLVEQVINNLVGNAIKYNRENGTIIVKAYTYADKVRVDIQDTGVGISPEEQLRIFEPFVRASSGDRVEGSGLGLAIVKTVVEMHGGEIWLESTPQVGSTFSFTLPSQKVQPFTAGEESDGVEDQKQDSREWIDKDSRHDSQ